MITEPWFWIFNAIVLALLAVDLLVLHRKAHEVKSGEATLLVGLWILLALGFAGWIGATRGAADASTFLFGYAIEYLLSVDNIFVFILLFAHFKVPAGSQHRVLFWGILGAIVMRASMIGAGVALIERFHWIIHVFGAFLVFSGIKMLFGSAEGVDPDKSALVRFVRRLLPMSSSYNGARFTVREGGRLILTPLVLVVVVVEWTDLIFAVDSIPAVFGITSDPFLIYTSNICAILGLRSLYFLLARMMKSFHYLKFGLAAILAFIGFKMLVSHYVPISREVSMGIIIGLLAISVTASLLARGRPGEERGTDG
jgi:tellurite resistance protein TerC